MAELLIGLCMLCVLVLVAIGIVLARRRPPPRPPGDGEPPLGSRADMARRLRKLADTPCDRELAPGAMCYSPAASPDRAEYVCPRCGEKTLFAPGEPNASRAYTVHTGIPACRRYAREIVDLDVELVEIGYCASCFPGSMRSRLDLEVRYPDGTAQRTEGVGETDLLMLVRFTTGKLTIDRGMMGEKLLKHQMPRLRELLGV